MITDKKAAYIIPNLMYFMLDNSDMLCQSDSSINDFIRDTETFDGIFD